MAKQSSAPKPDKPAAEAVPAGKFVLPLHDESHYPKLALGMLRVAHWIAAVGIDKNKVSSADGSYPYRGIDKVLDTLSLPLAEQGITVSPSYVEMQGREHFDKTTGKPKGVIPKVACTVTFEDVHGNKRVVGPVLGEAYDNMDKGLSKAESVAYRNLMLLTFVAPLGAIDPGSLTSHDPEDAQSQDNGTDGAGDPRDQPAGEAKTETVGERGIFLGTSQMAWFVAKMEQANWPESRVLAAYHRIDKENAKAVADYMVAHPMDPAA